MSKSRGGRQHSPKQAGIPAPGKEKHLRRPSRFNVVSRSTVLGKGSRTLVRVFAATNAVRRTTKVTAVHRFTRAQIFSSGSECGGCLDVPLYERKVCNLFEGWLWRPRFVNGRTAGKPHRWSADCFPRGMRFSTSLSPSLVAH